MGAERTVWRIGQSDHSYSEFAGADNYHGYAAQFGAKPIVFEVGRSDPARDWPFIQPGPMDRWAPAAGKPQMLRFTLPEEPQGIFTLRIEFADVHNSAPPRYAVALGNRSGLFPLQPGGGDASLTDAHVGKPQKLEIVAPASCFKKKGRANSEVLALDSQLQTFTERTRHVCGTARRRVLQGENVPNSEKLFSIFETHTQLYQRGKAGQPVQFGRQILIYEDGAGFISHACLMPRDADDRNVVVPQTRILQKRLEGRIRHASFDRGFHSPENQRDLAEILSHPCVPMPGAVQSRQQEAEATIEFRQARQRHSGIESAINALQAGNGLERCRDRSERGFNRYLQLAVLGRNLHVLGKILVAREDAECHAAESRRKLAAA